MRLLELRLLAFGAFTDTRLDFGATPAALHIVYGPNEAGKSTALRAIRGALFGIPRTTRDDYLHGTKNLRIGATLEYGAGRRLEFVRRKGLKRTLLDAAGEPIDEAELVAALGGVNEALFVSGFGLDHETLRSGAIALLEGEGQVGESLFGAGMGLLRVHRSLVALREEADGLFTPRGRTGKRINAALAEYRRARQEVNRASTSAQAFLLQESALDAARVERESLADKRSKLLRRRSHLERILVALPKLERRRQILAEVEALADAPEIAEEASARRKAAQADCAEADRQLDLIEVDRKRSLERRAELGERQSVVEMSEEEVLDVRNRLGRARAASADRPKLVLQREQLSRQIDKLLVQLRPGHPRSEMEKLRVEGRRLSRIKRLARRHDSLASRGEQLARTSRAIESRRARLEEERQKLGRDVGGRHLGPALQRATEVRSQVQAHAALALRAVAAERDTAALASSLALGADVLSPRELVSLALPTRHEVSEIRDELDEARRVLEDGRRVRDATSSRHSEATQRLQLLQKELDPSEGGRLRQARMDRDSAMKQLCEVLGDAEAAAPLAAEVERRVVSADQASDDLIADAARVARVNALAEEVAKAAEQLGEADQAHARNAAAVKEIERRYATLWPSRVAARSPGAMLEWLQRRDALHTALVQQGDVEAEATAIRATLEEARAVLAAELASANVDTEGVVKLDSLVDLATELLESRAKVAARQREIAGQLAEVEDSARDALLEAQRLEEERKVWRQEWHAATVDVTGGGDADPEEVLAIIDEMTVLFASVEKEQDLARRIAAIDRDTREAEQRADELVAKYAPWLDGPDWMDRAARLLESQRQAVADDEERARLAAMLGRADQGRGRALAARKAALGTLDQLCRAAGVADVAALEAAEQRSKQRSSLYQRLREIDEDLTLAGEGSSVEQLREAATHHDADGLRVELADLQRDEEETEEQLRDVDNAIGRYEAGVQRLGEGAANANEEAQLCLSELRGLVHRYVRVRLASTILATEIERYRQEHQGPVLERASELFPRLTGGHYSGLKTGFDDKDNQVLVCVRRDDVEVPVPALSDGARDQLYLALRLATLQRHGELNEPLPLILDDVLIHSDDSRAEAALAVLGEYAQSGQVLFFTHHHRLVELARRAVPSALLVEHRLPPPVATRAVESA